VNEPSLSLREVADRAGVAMSSVSRVLSGHPDVSATMRARVMAVVEELGYEPNLLAASLRRGSTMTVGAVVRDVSSPFYAAMALAAERVLRDAGYAMLVTSSQGSPELDAAQVSQFRRRRVDGLLLSVADESDGHTLEEIGRLRSPVVLVDCELRGVGGTSAVLCDHAGGIERVVEQLRGLGHRSAALVAGRVASRPARELVRAFEATCEWLSIAAAVERDVVDPAGAEAATARLVGRRGRPTAIVSGSAAILPGVLHAVRAAGLSVPAHMSVVTFDDAPLLEAVEPPIAAFDRDPVAVGDEAARLLLARIRGGPPETSSVAIRFTPRASCAPAPGV
jgi:LacI family transcriptional regulator, galactose operon repressor